MIGVAKLSPMMEQYVATKEKYKDCILFYRLGDFYEMFFDDAILASKELEITLTGKDCGMEERAPMCGIPFHAADTYINQLVKKGYKVAIGEQVEDPKLAKGLVKREVIRIVTPGTNLSSESLEESKNNYLMCISYVGKNYGISVTDLSTGVFKTCQIQQAEKVVDEINKFQPSEVLYQAGVEQVEEIHAVCERLQVSHTEAPDYYFNLETDEETLKRQFHINSIEGLGLKDSPACVASCGALMQYLHETQMSSLSHINHIETYSVDSFMILDSATRRNLELTETLRDKQKRGSLLWVLDKTKTAMGARKLREFVEQPLLYKDAIEKRLDAIEAINKELIVREELREYLNTIYDLERLLTRIALKTANPRDLLAFKTSIQYLPDIYNLLRELPCERINEIYEDYDSLEDLYDLLEQAIVEEPPVSIKEGGIFKQGYRDEIDELRLAKTECKTWLAELESKEREKTGIKGLKIKYNKVFDYYFEVTNSFKSLVPDYFIRKQTLVNAERFTTDELNTLSGKILGAEDKLYALEYDCYVELREKLAAALVRVQKMAGYIAELDALCSLAYVADKNNYVRPSLNTDGVIDIKGGRHPVVEKMLANDSFVENDTYLNNAESRISIITGPNMAGKSTYMRQVALITLMAQIGSFVPARAARIGVVDRIFTRIGASDDLAGGQSTFMVEMSEVAEILRQATAHSLLILDEIGRGTSTFDGMSIARAVLEFCADRKRLGAKTLFATHYHELTELEGTLAGVKNYNIAIKKRGEDLVFLRKIIPGGADRSYGIEVAKLAGLPKEVVSRAKKILEELEAGGSYIPPREEREQVSLDAIGEAEVLDALRRAQPDTMSPIEAMQLLYDLKKKLPN